MPQLSKRTAQPTAATSSKFMKDYKQFTQNINDFLANLPFPAHPEGLYEPIAYALTMGGKRLRPVYLLLCQQLWNGEASPAVVAAAALEMYHNYTLLHDDLMDNADKRRGQPTVHRKWNANTTILSGDAMLLVACRMMYDSLKGVSAQAFELFQRTALEVMEGQQYDMNFETRQDVTLEEYYEMIRLKTGVLIACATGMGALIGGAPVAEAEQMFRYGAEVGRAFQLQDDYLDVFGDTQVFGKNIGGDILEGKKTYLLIQALCKASAAQKQDIWNWLNNQTVQPELKIAHIKSVYEQLGVDADCRQAVKACYERAETILQSVAKTGNLSDEAVCLLSEFSIFLKGRNF